MSILLADKREQRRPVRRLLSVHEEENTFSNDWREGCFGSPDGLRKVPSRPLTGMPGLALAGKPILGPDTNTLFRAALIIDCGVVVRRYGTAAVAHERNGNCRRSGR